MPVFLFADERCSQIVVWGLDNVPQGHPEWVDEEVNYGIFPFYCLGDGKERKSPVYYLMNIADAIKQFFQHTKVPKPEVSRGERACSSAAVRSRVETPN